MRRDDGTRGRRSRRRAAAAAALLLGGALVLAPAAARAHAELRASDPPDGAVLRAAPGHVALAFTEPMRVTSLRLLDGAGRERPLRREGPRAAAVAELRAAVAGPLPPGEYRVEYRGLSADGHAGGGELRFRVDPAAAPR